MNIFNLGMLCAMLLVSTAAPAQVLYRDQVIYWQEKKLGRALSDYERGVVLSEYIKGKPITQDIKTPYAIKKCLGRRKQT